MLRQRVTILAIGVVWAAGHASLGAEILCTASSVETYVGAPVQIQVIIKGARVYEPPTFPDVEGADVRELRQEGRKYPTVTRPARGEGYTVVYTYAVTPRRAGTISIPPIRVTVDGELFSTSPMQIVAKESEAGDLLYLELLGEREYVYVGEPFNATLEIWLKPYKSKGVRMDAENMWRYTIDEDTSAWGPFKENLEARPQNITYRTDTRADANGDARSYFVYSLSREVWAERPGVFDADNVTVVVDYPLKMRHKRATLLGRPYEIVESRPVSAKVEDPKIVVRAPPPEGRPDAFRGAVGSYTMTVTAAPTEVSVGDPITLTLAIRGTGRMDVLSPPLLANQESLTTDFRVPDEELAGTVSGKVKEFSQNIRAKHDRAVSIPPIRFSYFDPVAEQYVTLNSDPIPLKVKESARSALSQIVADAGSADGAPSGLTASETGVWANYDDLQALLANQSLSFGWGTWGFAAAGPLLCLACLLVRRHRDRVAGDAGLERRRSARKTAIAAVRGAIAATDGSAAASHAAIVVTRYVADRCNLPPGNVNRDDVIAQLRLRNLPDATIDRVDELLAECEGAQYGAAEHADAKGFIERARDCVNELERQKL
jgi:hypothetical protein